MSGEYSDEDFDPEASQPSNRVEGIMSGQRQSKILAVQLFLSQRARQQTADDPEQWRLHPASTLLSGVITIPPAAGR